jgi:hypothetical protein
MSPEIHINHPLNRSSHLIIQVSELIVLSWHPTFFKFKLSVFLFLQSHDFVSYSTISCMTTNWSLKIKLYKVKFRCFMNIINKVRLKNSCWISHNLYVKFLSRYVWWAIKYEWRKLFNQFDKSCVTSRSSANGNFIC